MGTTGRTSQPAPAICSICLSLDRRANQPTNLLVWKSNNNTSIYRISITDHLREFLELTLILAPGARTGELGFEFADTVSAGSGESGESEAGRAAVYCDENNTLANCFWKMNHGNLWLTMDIHGYLWKIQG